MAEKLKYETVLQLVNDIYAKAVRQWRVGEEACLGIGVAIDILRDPNHSDLWERLKAFCEEEKP